MKTFLSAILTVLFFMVFGLILVVFHPIQMIAKVLFGGKVHDSSVAILNLLLTKTLLILGTKVKYINFHKLPTDKPLIVICNHQSMWDIPPLIWKFRKHHLKFIAKKELAKNIPSISYNLKYGGSVVIDRKKPTEAVVKIRLFSKYILAKNYAVCIFPEGTRNPKGEIRPFKSGGLKALLEEMPNALIVPVAIKDTGKIDSSGKFLKNIGINISYTLLAVRSIEIDQLEQQLSEIRKEMMDIV